MKAISYQRVRGKHALKTAFFASPFAFSKTRRHAFRIIHLPSGEPAIEGKSCRASIAHTNGWAIGAVAQHAIGVDIECVRARIHASELLRYIASLAEQQICARLCKTEPAYALTILWVVKESVRKCLGIRRPVSPRELVIYKRDGNTFFARWRKNNTAYKAYITEHSNTLVARAFPLRVKQHITYCVVHACKHTHTTA